MTTITKDKNLVPFLFMGCWNRDDAPRKIVADSILQNPIETLILGGDNVYPKKVYINNATGFSKVYSMKTLMNGVQMLYGKNIYATLGNHNIGGPMLNTQLGLSEWTMPARYYCVQFNDIALIVIDSNLVEESAEFNKMSKWLEDTTKVLKDSRKKYFYVQHEPFISFKKKKKTVLYKGEELLKILSGYPPIAILCADTHNYQRGKIELSDGTIISQVICGAGGADPDYVSANISNSFSAGDLKYTMEDYVPGYGYLEIKDVDDINFVKVADWRNYEGKGGRNFLGKSSQKRSKTQKSFFKKSSQKRSKTQKRSKITKNKKTYKKY